MKQIIVAGVLLAAIALRADDEAASIKPKPSGLQFGDSVTIFRDVRIVRGIQVDLSPIHSWL